MYDDIITPFTATFRMVSDGKIKNFDWQGIGVEYWDTVNTWLAK
jgi:hypothetical protein